MTAEKIFKESIEDAENDHITAQKIVIIGYIVAGLILAIKICYDLLHLFWL